MYEKDFCKNKGFGRKKTARLVRRAESEKESDDRRGAGEPVRVGNFYMIFRAIYDIGREDARQEVIEIELLEIPDFVPADTLPDRRIREMEEFFNQFNRQGNE